MKIIKKTYNIRKWQNSRNLTWSKLQRYAKARQNKNKLIGGKYAKALLKKGKKQSNYNRKKYQKEYSKRPEVRKRLYKATYEWYHRYDNYGNFKL